MSNTIVKVCFLGELRSVAGRRAMDVPVAPGATIHTLLQHLCEKLGEPFAREVFDANGNLFHHLSIFVNDRGLDGDRRLEATLYGGEVDLLILPVFEGG